jgi:hypothetical protein
MKESLASITLDFKGNYLGSIEGISGKPLEELFWMTDWYQIK